MTIQKIEQVDNYHFLIQWADGSTQTFRLSDLQRNCPCAQCMDEMTGKPLLDPTTVPDEVKALSIRSVGRYGLKIEFSSGCSMGIFSFDRLKGMNNV